MVASSPSFLLDSISTVCHSSHIIEASEHFESLHLYKTSESLKIEKNGTTLYGDAATIRAFHDRIAVDINPSLFSLYISILGNLTMKRLRRIQTLAAYALV